MGPPLIEKKNLSAQVVRRCLPKTRNQKFLLCLLSQKKSPAICIYFLFASNKLFLLSCLNMAAVSEFDRISFFFSKVLTTIFTATDFFGCPLHIYVCYRDASAKIKCYSHKRKSNFENCHQCFFWWKVRGFFGIVVVHIPEKGCNAVWK